MLGLVKKKIIILAVILILIIGGVYAYIQFNKSIQLAIASKFEECEAAGYPVAESYPRICTTPDGRSLVEDIGNELEYTDFIRVDSPRPNTTIKSPLVIAGMARGTWFWEGNSTAELYDGSGKSIGFGHVVATGEWMTSDFVSMEGKIEFENPDTLIGKLVLRNDNPSGLAENQKELTVPVRFKRKLLHPQRPDTPQ